jgi:hypothetical protein
MENDDETRKLVDRAASFQPLLSRSPITILQIHVRVLASTYRLGLSLVEPVTWKDVAMKVLAYHLLAMESSEERKQIENLSIHSVVNVRKGATMRLQDIVKHRDLSSYLYPSTFEIRLEGPFSSHAHLILPLACKYLCAKPELNALLRVSKHFNRVTSGDSIWDGFNFAEFSIWQGSGNMDDENTFWRAYKWENGLPFMNCVR